jgi:aspartyl-tRNA synthetase
MSFARAEDVMQCAEAVIKRLWTEMLGVGISDEAFPRMTYAEAMSKYGSDKPDARIGMEISRVDYLLPADMISKVTHLRDPFVEMMKMTLSDDPRETREFISAFMDSPEAEEFLTNPDGGPGIFVFDSRKPLQGLQPLGFEAAEVIGEDLEDGDLVVLQARKNSPFSGGSTALGNLRRALHKAAVGKGLLTAQEGFDFRWITDFPLFSSVNDTDPGQGGDAGIASTHHPFTSPKDPADVDLLLTDPSKVIGDHYDLVVNGVELGGGSRRIHHAAMQELMLKDVLKIPEERLLQFTHLLEALRAGCPPHAGIALGFDRLIAVMLGKESVRDVIAFPKSGKGEDVMVRSPGLVSQETLETYNLKLKE